MTVPIAEPTDTTIATDVACPVCGCACDDLRLTIQGANLISTEPHCRLAEPWFQRHAAAHPPAAKIEGQPASLESALSRATELLQSADAPLIFGLSRSSTPGQRMAVQLADEIGAVIDTTASLGHGSAIMAVQSVGESTCTLGEIRNRADLVIFWGCNPAVTHPRHAERYSVFPTGELIPHGRADREVVFVGQAREVDEWKLDAKGSPADRIIRIHHHHDFEAISILRSLVTGKPIRGDLTLRETGADFQELAQLAERMKACRYGIVFFGLGLTERNLERPRSVSGSGHLIVGNLLKLVTELNAFTRFHARRMRIQGDVTGADNVMCWQTGYPFSVSMANGYPRYNPGEFTANDVLERGEVDACLLVGSESVKDFSESARDYLGKIPTISIDYPNTVADPQRLLTLVPTVQITTCVYGLHAAGTLYRMDEVPLPMKALLKSEYPTDEWVLSEFSRRIASAKS